MACHGDQVLSSLHARSEDLAAAAAEQMSHSPPPHGRIPGALGAGVAQLRRLLIDSPSRACSRHDMPQLCCFTTAISWTLPHLTGRAAT